MEKLHKMFLILGHKNHGKDTAAQILEHLFGLKFKSSSTAAAEIFLYDALKEKYGYKSPEECFEDRVNRRAEWYQLIREYNKDDRARLAKDILQESDIYVGMRDNEEFLECKRQVLFDLVIGIYDPRKPLEDSSSFNIDFWNSCDIIIPNAGTILDLQYKLYAIKPLLK